VLRWGGHWVEPAGLRLPKLEIPDAVWKIYPDLSHAHDWEAAIAATSFVPDDVVAQLCDAMGLVGTPADCAARIVEMTKLGVQNLYVMPLLTFGLPESELAAFRDVVFPKLAAAGIRPACGGTKPNRDGSGRGGRARSGAGRAGARAERRRQGAGVHAQRARRQARQAQRADGEGAGGPLHVRRRVHQHLNEGSGGLRRGAAAVRSRWRPGPGRGWRGVPGAPRGGEGKQNQATSALRPPAAETAGGRCCRRTVRSAPTSRARSTGIPSARTSSSAATAR